MSQKKLTNELLQLRVIAENKAIKQQKELLKAYKHSLQRVRKELGEIYMQHDIEGDLRIGRSQRYSVLTQLEKELVKQARDLGATDTEVTTQILEGVYKESYYKTAYLLEKGIETGINFAILRPEFIKAAINMPIEGVMFSDRIWTNKAKLASKVRQSVERALIDGTDIRKLAKEVSGDFGSSIYDSNRLIQTEIARCHSLAQEQIYEDSGLVQKVMWSATLEENTCEDCGMLDSQEYNLDDPNKPEIPLHPLCRCVWISILPEYRPTRRRDQSSGDIIEYKTYNQWAKDKGIE